MKKLLCSILLVIALVGAGFVGYSYGTAGGYIGYTVVFNGETGKGFVYENANIASALIVIYPNVNQAYLYSTEGRLVTTAEAALRTISDPARGVVASIVATINPVH